MTNLKLKVLNQWSDQSTSNQGLDCLKHSPYHHYRKFMDIGVEIYILMLRFKALVTGWSDDLPISQLKSGARKREANGHRNPMGEFFSRAFPEYLGALPMACVLEYPERYCLQSSSPWQCFLVNFCPICKGLGQVYRKQVLCNSKNRFQVIEFQLTQLRDQYNSFFFPKAGLLVNRYWRLLSYSLGRSFNLWASETPS